MPDDRVEVHKQSRAKHPVNLYLAGTDGWIHLPGGATRRGVSGEDLTLNHQVFRVDRSCGPAA